MSGLVSIVDLQNSDRFIDNLTENIVILSIRNNIGNNENDIICIEAARIIADLLTSGIKAGFMEKEDKRHPNIYKGHFVDPEKSFVFIYEVEKYGKRIGFSEDTNELTTYTVLYLSGGTLFWCNISQLEF